MEWILGPLAKLGEAITWYKAFSLAVGEGFYATFALGALVAIIVLAWRSPKLPWFTGKVALALVVGLLAVATLAFLVVAYDREVQPHLGGETPRPAPAKPGKAGTPSKPPAPVVREEIGG